MKTALKLIFTGAANAVFLFATSGCAVVGDSTLLPQLKAATPAALQILGG